MTPKRFTRQDWLMLGLKVLRQEGPGGLTVEEICNHAQKTRGSFYFHFENVEAFHVALVTVWKAEFTDKLAMTTPKRTGSNDLLNQLAVRVDPRLETGIRQLALLHPSVRETVQAADEARVTWLSRLYEESGAYTRSEAQDLARLEYAAFIGFRLLEPELTDARSKELYDAFLRFTDRY